MIKTNYLFGFIFLFFHCAPEKTSTPENRETPSSSSPIPSTEEPAGTPYSDSMIASLTQSKPSAELPIDTFRVLHSFTAQQFLQQSLSQITIDTINKYEKINRPLRPEQQLLLNQTDCFVDLSFSEGI